MKVHVCSMCVHGQGACSVKVYTWSRCICLLVVVAPCVQLIYQRRYLRLPVLGANCEMLIADIDVGSCGCLEFRWKPCASAHPAGFGIL